MKTLKVMSGLALALSMGTAQMAVAASHDRGLDACKAATMEAVGDAKVRLSSIERNGKTYNMWLDVFVGDRADATRMSAFCKVRGRDVLDLVTAEGSWGKTAKREIAKNAAIRVAQK